MNILHISDLHMTFGNENNSIARKIDLAIKDHPNLYPDVLVVTGDFTNSGSSIEFNNAQKMITTFKKYDSLKNINYKVFVPGNHDFQWDADGKQITDEQRKINYINFVFSNELKTKKIKVEKKIQEKLNSFLIDHIIYKNENNNFLIIGMNSMQIDSKERAGQGYFSNEQLDVVKELINYYKNKVGNITTIIAFHHHIIPVSVVERDTLKNKNKFSLTLDARRLINFCLENDILFALHGHQHQPSITTWQDNMNFPNKKLHIISAGSLCSSLENVGDITKNDFMIYSINHNEMEIKHFLNSNADKDRFVLDSETDCKFSINSATNTRMSCNYSVNNYTPKELVFKKITYSEDTSNLFYSYLTVIDCAEASAAIDAFTNEYNKTKQNKVEICGIHHLYGKYDILLKYRDNSGSDDYNKKLIKYLKKEKHLDQNYKNYFMNVSVESYFSEEKDSLPFINNKDAYLNSTWNMATIRVDTGAKLNPETFLIQLKQNIDRFNFEYKTQIEDIVKNYAIGQDQVIIFELFISCYQFPMLTKFTNLIEDVAKIYGIDKSTHIIYYYDERKI